MESLKFLFHRTIYDARGIKVEFVLEETADEESLADTPTAIYGNELTPARLHIVRQLTHLFFSTYNLFHCNKR